tara:strand:- start:628 stop:825 length:198 start_codon:yes stop_codon:yes gene_type:complete
MGERWVGWAKGDILIENAVRNRLEPVTAEVFRDRTDCGNRAGTHLPYRLRRFDLGEIFRLTDGVN